MKEVTRPTDMGSFLHSDRHVLAEYTSAVKSAGPFSFAYMSIHLKDTEEKYEPHYYAVASDYFPLAPELILDDSMTIRAIIAPLNLGRRGIYQQPWSTLLSENHCQHLGSINTATKVVNLQPVVTPMRSSLTYKNWQASSC